MLVVSNTSSNLFDHKTSGVCKVYFILFWFVRGQYNFCTCRLRRFSMVTPFIPFAITIIVNSACLLFLSNKLKKYLHVCFYQRSEW